MKILIANDDGIHGEGLQILVNWAKKMGQVTVIAPKTEQSGKSHSIELHRPIEVKKVEYMEDVEAYTIDTTPADCVRFAVIGLEKKFDLVFSGINCGTNLGSDIEYSGTVGIIYEAKLMGIPAVAFSTTGKAFPTIAPQLDVIWDFFSKNKLMEKHDMYNVNIPLEPKGIKVTRQGGHYSTDTFVPLGNNLYQPKLKNLYQQAHDYSVDTNAYRNGYISIMPLTTLRTQMDVFEALKGLND